MPIWRACCRVALRCERFLFSVAFDAFFAFASYNSFLLRPRRVVLQPWPVFLRSWRSVDFVVVMFCVHPEEAQFTAVIERASQLKLVEPHLWALLDICALERASARAHVSVSTLLSPRFCKWLITVVRLHHFNGAKQFHTRRNVKRINALCTLHG